MQAQLEGEAGEWVICGGWRSRLGARLKSSTAVAVGGCADGLAQNGCEMGDDERVGCEIFAALTVLPPPLRAAAHVHVRRDGAAFFPAALGEEEAAEGGEVDGAVAAAGEACEDVETGWVEADGLCGNRILWVRVPLVLNEGRWGFGKEFLFLFLHQR